MEIPELNLGPTDSPEDQRLAIQEIVAKINELIRELNERLK